MISIVIPVLNQFPLVKKNLELLAENLSGTTSEILIIDNASDQKFDIDAELLEKLNAKCKSILIRRNEKNIGNYPVFKQGLDITEGNIIAFFHSDLLVCEKGFNERIESEFQKNSNLGLVGFLGSNEIDNFGGRGSGTMSNFQGGTYEQWKGSPYNHHGRQVTGIDLAAVVDGCAMIFRRDVLENLPTKEVFPMHHFYDRLMSCQVREGNHHVAVLGIACDHISGQTVNQEKRVHDSQKEWMQSKFGTVDNWVALNKVWINSSMNPSRGKLPSNDDHWMYLEAERQFLSEYRDQKHLIPKRV